MCKLLREILKYQIICYHPKKKLSQHILLHWNIIKNFQARKCYMHLPEWVFMWAKALFRVLNLWSQKSQACIRSSPCLNLWDISICSFLAENSHSVHLKGGPSKWMSFICSVNALLHFVEKSHSMHLYVIWHSWIRFMWVSNLLCWSVS